MVEQVEPVAQGPAFRSADVAVQVEDELGVVPRQHPARAGQAEERDGHQRDRPSGVRRASSSVMALGGKASDWSAPEADDLVGRAARPANGLAARQHPLQDADGLEEVEVVRLVRRAGRPTALT